MASKAGPPQRVNNSIEFWKYLNTVRILIDQANTYRKRGDENSEYELLFRAASMIIETLPKHSALHKPSKDKDRYVAKHADYKAMMRTTLVPRLEELKTKERRSKAYSHAVKPHAAQLKASNLPQVSWQFAQPAVDASRQTPANFVAENATVDRFYAQQSAPPPPAGDPNDPFAASNLYSTPAAASAPVSTAAPGLALPAVPEWASQMSMRSASGGSNNKHALFAQSNSNNGNHRYPAPAATGSRPLYPTVPDFEAGLDLLNTPPRNLPAPPEAMAVTQQVVTKVPEPPGPSAPGTCTHAHAESAPAALPEVSGPREVPVSVELRNVYISPGLLSEFLKYAQMNTKRGIESCGILAGELAADDAAFTITNLIIPKQKGEANTVEMLNEEEIFEYQFARGLLPLGWIHTHPTQTCFLSSIDVHTHCGFQVMLPEAMAIVMAPTDPRNKCGIFRLTTPGGMGIVQTCTEKGFHMHPRPQTGQEIYELCGHVFLDETAKFSSIDMR